MSMDDKQQQDQNSPLRFPQMARAQVVRCPFCHSADTEPLASFGSQLSTEQHYCRSCRTPFEYMKQDDEPAEPSR